MTKINKAAVVGGGVIGGGWAARLVWPVLMLDLADPDPDAKRKLDAIMADAERAMARLWPGQTLGNIGSLTYEDSIGAAVAGADLVQEITPERLDLKNASIKELVKPHLMMS